MSMRSSQASSEIKLSQDRMTSLSLLSALPPWPPRASTFHLELWRARLIEQARPSRSLPWCPWLSPSPRRSCPDTAGAAPGTCYAAPRPLWWEPAAAAAPPWQTRLRHWAHGAPAWEPPRSAWSAQGAMPKLCRELGCSREHPQPLGRSPCRGSLLQRDSCRFRSSSWVRWWTLDN